MSKPPAKASKKPPEPWEVAPLKSAPMRFTRKPVSLSQRDIDQLLVQRAVDFSGQNLEGLDLSFAELAGSSWYGASLSGTVLSDARFRGVDGGYGALKVERARLHKTVMHATFCRFTHFEDCVFMAPDVLGARFEDVRMSGCLLENVHLRGLTLENSGPTSGGRPAWHELRGYDVVFEDCAFKRLTMGSSYFHQARLLKTSFVGCKLNKVHFAAELTPLAGSDVSLTGCEADKLWMPRAQISGLRLERTQLVLPRLDHARLQGTLLDFKIEGGSAVGSQWGGSTFKKGVWGTRHVETDLSGASFAGCTFENVAFLRCRLTDVDWTGADLSRISFRDCIDRP